MRKRKLTLTLACMLALTAMAQSKLDSVQHVREIIVVSKPAMREVVPSQKLKGELLEQLNTHSVADALRYFSGIQLKDYGDVGPFEAYVMLDSNSSATRCLSIFGDDDTTDIMDLPTSSDHNGNNKVYSLSGRLIKQGKDDKDLQNLPKGVYIINGKKVIK